ncbi:MAG: SIS domain-containing protein, partial [Flavobacteriales bacterium]
MKDFDKIIRYAKETLKKEAEAVNELIPYIDGSFAKAVSLIKQTEGRVVITGIGKSAIIANKIVATLNSTGTPSLFMHAAEAIHGDLGNVQKKDIVICISKSGKTSEITVLVPLIKHMGNPLIALTGNTSSYLAENADHVINATVSTEACPNDLAPTSSTTAQLALGDAIAMCLMKLKGFSQEDFARYHPGGALGKKLYLRMGDFLEKREAPAVSPDDPVSKIVYEISSKRLGMTAVIENEEIKGMITDGDLRRMLEGNDNTKGLKASDIMTYDPKTMDESELAVNAFKTMEEYNITQILVTSNNK